MEKISALIDKLQELKHSGAGLQTISYYTQLLQAEILHQRNLQKQQEVKGNGHVAVIMPAHMPAEEKPYVAPPVHAAQEPVHTPPVTIPEKIVIPPVQQPVYESRHTPPPVQEKPVQPSGNTGYQPDKVPVKPPKPAEADRPVTATLFDAPGAETPAPAQPKGAADQSNGNGIRKELNELVGKQSPSLNDRLRNAGNVELGEKLGGMGVKDLKSAIGINDKFQFIQELFRGDQVMYERSVKTINESTSLVDAEYWIERELKIKLGWDESDQLVNQFYSLVRKRFS